eukprot:CAMPEP_0202696126 /NCGR_PEP_ID=MMETSP1385-20130828/9469_1 /ASSEMBLY_ACC=CAM_ASM_000861 /TAXON_ID=933848 /ORGANISM="Elphidium margaritaceum" /LENGTH=307 /DNA_ID=CAMNT_0049352237 /DNA_START=48 /DNA_END=968 /DNA_ORIENTATION=-
MPVPKTRIVVTKDDGIKTERIPRRTEKARMFLKKGRTIGAMQRLTEKAGKFDRRKAKQGTQRLKDLNLRKPFKHLKTRGSSFQFRRIETLVKNRHSKMKHWSLCMQRHKNPKYRQILHRQVKDVPTLLIVRLHRRKNIPKNILVQLAHLGLAKAWDCVLVRNTPSLQQTLVDVMAFVTFGAPSTALVRDLVMKRGRVHESATASDNPRAQKVAIKSNVIVEKILGEFGVICIEDIIHVLNSNPTAKNANDDDDDDKEDNHVVLEDGTKKHKADVFDGVANALNPFKLNSINVPIRGLSCPFNKRGYW